MTDQPEDKDKIIRVAKYDTNAVKQALDDQVIRIVSEVYDENVRGSNIKLALGAVGIVVALVSQFWPLPFPQNQSLLITCVAIYIITSAIAQVYAYFEGNSIYETQASDYSPEELRVFSGMGRYGSEWEVRLTDRKTGKVSVAMKKSVSEWFDLTGRLAVDKFDAEFRKVLGQWEAAVGQKRKSKTQ